MNTSGPSGNLANASKNRPYELLVLQLSLAKQVQKREKSLRNKYMKLLSYSNPLNFMEIGFIIDLNLELLIPIFISEIQRNIVDELLRKP